ncbi:hypothetical protein [Legionella drancourtii]|uniref:Uncharacterized protein n=1 Tax=Legionella drancourtii LLAP12 TaxID=658187 RepID=G9EL89_9GAMM|nr:hypothetical protein [Legionella drancourtii]EHL31978.1 hypothetical protein LDG_6148 [Legionella drancourtii LLAP12]
MTIQQKRVVALLDVDNTLIFGAPPDIEYNDKLIDTLLENNVKDVYLFSSMSLKQRTLEERIVLIEYLQSKGLTVHGVICASDLVWNKDKALLQAFYQAMCKTKSDEEILELLSQEQFKPLTHFDDATSGQAFASVRAGVDGWSREDAELYQATASAIRRYLDHNNTSEHKAHVAETEKSYFYQMFARNKPEWSGAVIFVDDADTNINAVKGMHNQLTPEYKLLTLHNRNERREVKNPKNFYQAIIQPFVEITFALFNAFNSYKIERKLTYSTAKKEILERLELSLENCKTSDEVRQVKDDFDKEYQQLNHHRFSFWSDAKTRSATVFDDMVEKREEQLKLK